MTWSWSPTTSGTTYAKSSVTLYKNMDLENIKVTFTQDDIKYYFEITANASIDDTGRTGRINYCPSPILYKKENFAGGMKIEESVKAPYASCYNGNFGASSNIQILGNTILEFIYSYKLTGGRFSLEDSNTSGNGDKYFIPNSLRPSFMSVNENYRDATNYPIGSDNNGEGAEVLNNNSISDFYYVDDENPDYDYCANYNVKISIEKEYIDDYRYLAFAETFVRITLNTEGDRGGSYEGSSYCTNTIDLKAYVDCNHTWEYETYDKTNHKMICNKCKWEKVEKHNSEYEYDGLKNNLCVCGMNSYVNHHFQYDSDKTADKIVKLTASSSCAIYANPTKTGYIFNHYEKYYKYFKNMAKPVFSKTATALTNTLIGNITNLPTKSDRFSQIFVAKYDPIKYSVIFNKNSNLGFNVSLTGISNLSNIEYDKSYDVPVVSYAGYTFKGWSLTSGSSTININTTDKIKNLTTTNAKTINIYPVFSKNKYTFKFATESNIKKINITNDLVDLSCEYGTKYKLPNNIQVTGYIFKGWSLTKGSTKIDFEPNAEINNYTTVNNKVFIIYPIYEAIKYSVVFNKNSNLGFDVSLASVSNLSNIEYDEEYNVPIVSYVGYIFKGWSLTSGSSKVDINIISKIKNLTTIDAKTLDVFPVFETNKYMFKFATESNINKITITENVESLLCEYGTKYKLPNNIEVKGYNFKGWSLTKGSSNIDFNLNAEIYNYTPTNNKTIIIYPVYEPIKYKFIFSNDNMNGLIIEGKVDDEEFIYDENPKELNKNINIRAYNFIGWSLIDTSDKIEFAPKQKIFNYTDIDDKTFTLYPVYEPLKINIVYNTNLGNFIEGNQLATISYIVNDMKDFDYPSVDPNNTYNKRGELYKSDYLEFTGYKCNNIIFNTFDEFKEYILDRGVQNDNIELSYNGKVKVKYYKTVYGYDDDNDDDVTPNMGPLKSSSKEIVYDIGEPMSEVLDNTLVYSYVNETAYQYINESTYKHTYDINRIRDSLRKNVKKEKEEIEESEIEDSELEDSGEIIATLSVADKWRKDNDWDIENISKLEMLLMIMRENKIQFIALSLLLIIILIVYEIIVYKYYKVRKKSIDRY